MVKRKNSLPLFSVGDYVKDNYGGAVYRVSHISDHREYRGWAYWCRDFSTRVRVFEYHDADRLVKVDAWPITLSGDCIAFATRDELIDLANLLREVLTSAE